MSYKILLVEDEENLAKAILLNLDLEGYVTTWIKNGNSANSELLKRPNHFDLVILDVMLPEKDGLEICKNVRLMTKQLPILFLSARNSGHDKVLGLKAGGDDYLGKPFNLEEFLLRVKILIERSNQSAKRPDQFSFGKNNFYPDRSVLDSLHQDNLSLSSTENKILNFFIKNSGRNISRDEMIEDLWNDSEVSGRSIDNVISRFRKWCEENPKKPKHFISVRGIGYRFES